MGEAAAAQPYLARVPLVVEVLPAEIARPLCFAADGGPQGHSAVTGLCRVHDRLHTTRPCLSAGHPMEISGEDEASGGGHEGAGLVVIVCCACALCCDVIVV